MQYLKSLSLKLYNDKIFLLSLIIVSFLALSNVLNKLFLGWEPLQYSLFSYDKVLHLLSTIIIVRVVYWNLIMRNPDYSSRIHKLKASIITFIIYGVFWESFELFTFFIQYGAQFWLELFDIPLDWIYDVFGLLLSNFLGYSDNKTMQNIGKI